MSIRIILSCFLVLQGSLVSSIVYGFDDTPDCFKKLETGFFIPSYTLQAFSLHNVPQSSWTLIYNQLQTAVQRVPGIVERKAEKMKINPLRNPFDSEKAWGVLEETLFEVFLSVLRDNNTFHQYNDNNIRGMFEYIKQKQSAYLKTCLNGKNVTIKSK